MICSWPGRSQASEKKGNMRLSLNEVYERFGLPASGINGIQVRGVSIDTRILETGMLFFALAGENHDGHEFIGEALREGACAVVVKKDKRIRADSARIMEVDDPLFALQDLAAYYRSQFDIPVIAITGSNGKTTTKEMLTAVLASKWRVSRSSGNWNNQYRTTPKHIRME